MFRWIPFVFVRITLVFMAGILWAIYWPDSLSEQLAQGLLLSLSICYLFFWWVNAKNIKKLQLGGLGLTCVLIAGYVSVLIRTDSRDADHFMHLHQPITHYKVTIDSYSQEKEKSWKTNARVSQVRVNNEWREVTGKVLLYFSKEDFPKACSYGDVLLIKGSPQEVQPPSNPGEFDYKRFLSYKKNYHQHFLRNGNVQNIGHVPRFVLMKYAIEARIWATNQLHNYVTGAREQAIATALVLGVTDGLDNDIMQTYSATGAMHVLAVSGLHVGIIYGIIVFLLKPVAKRRGGKWIIAVVSFVLLWMYAFVTGLSPSVLRAVTMFSFVAFARPLNWSSTIYNTLAISAFCLLLYEPYMLMSVGFQLSYLAVLGIVYCQSPLYKIWEAPNWLLDKIWQITTVSIAAQLATVSLGLLYFHQFPVYFILSNLLVIPISFSVLLLGLLVLVVSFIAPLASIVGYLLTWAIQLMNGSVLAIESLPHSLLGGIYITTLQAWIIMGILICAVLLLTYKRFSYLLGAFILVVFFSGSSWQYKQHQKNQHQWIVYKIQGHQAIDFTISGKNYFLADSLLEQDQQRLQFHIQPNRLLNTVSTTEQIEDQPFTLTQDGWCLIHWHGKNILVVKKRLPSLPQLSVDFVVIGHNAVSIKEITEHINFKTLIVDSSNSFYFAEKMRREAIAANITVHSVLHQGFFRQHL